MMWNFIGLLFLIVVPFATLYFVFRQHKYRKGKIRVEQVPDIYGQALVNKTISNHTGDITPEFIDQAWRKVSARKG